MARFLGYDIYNVYLSRADVAGDDPRALLLHTTPRSLVLVEDLDQYLQGGSGDAVAHVVRVLSFMDGVTSCCGEECVMVFTMRGGKDTAVVRPGRLDVHIQFTLCDFEAFKALTSNNLGAGAQGPQAVLAGGGGVPRRRRPPQPDRAWRDHADQPRVPEPRAP
jgi:hypothetical protein